MVKCAKMPLTYGVLQGRITAAFFAAQSNTESRLNMGDILSSRLGGFFWAEISSKKFLPLFLYRYDMGEQKRGCF